MISFDTFYSKMTEKNDCIASRKKSYSKFLLFDPACTSGYTLKAHRSSTMALAEQIVDFQIRMLVDVHPVPSAHSLVNDERTIVILMGVQFGFGDVMLGQCLIGYIRKLADRYIPDIAFRIIFLDGRHCHSGFRRVGRIFISLCYFVGHVALRIFDTRLEWNLCAVNNAKENYLTDKEKLKFQYNPSENHTDSTVEGVASDGFSVVVGSCLTNQAVGLDDAATVDIVVDSIE